jgi:hypothetical protein
MEIAFSILVLLAVLVFGINIGGWLKEKELSKKILSKENVAACFKDVDWGRQVFTTNSGTMETPDGCKHFYKVHSIDRAIEKLNSLMAQSPANKACSGQEPAGESESQKVSGSCR